MKYTRYPKYKDSGIEWIGKIPEHWDVTRARWLFREINDRSTNGDELLLSVSEYYGVKPKNEVVGLGDFLTHAASLIDYKKCKKNDLVINIMLAWKGALGITDYDGIVSPSYNVFRPIEDRSAKYFHYLLRTSLYADIFRINSTGITDSRLRLYPDSFESVNVIYPSLEEQTLISKYLECEVRKLENLELKHKNMIKLLKEKRQAVITQAVTKGLHPNVPMKDSGIEWIGNIPKHWKVKEIKRNFMIINGSTPRSDTENYWGGQITWVTPEDLSSTEQPVIEESKRKLTIEGYKSCGTTLVPNGSIILSTRAPIGQVKIASSELCFNQGCKSLVKKYDNVNEYYFYYILDSTTDILNSIGQGSTFLELSNDNLGMYITPVPPLTEQIEISEFLNYQLNKINLMVNKQQSMIKLLNDYKSSLISNAVTGKIDVRGLVKEVSENGR